MIKKIVSKGISELSEYDIFVKAQQKIIKLRTFPSALEDPSLSRGLDELRELIETGLRALNAPRRSSQSSGISSVMSLGANVAYYDKERLYKYDWVNRKADYDEWQQGNDFKTWIKSRDRLPQYGSKINCWESVMILVYLHDALTKENIEEVYEKSGQDDDKAVKEILGLNKTFSVSMDQVEDFIHPGDILQFKLKNGQDLAHIVIVLDNQREKAFLVSHWRSVEELYQHRSFSSHQTLRLTARKVMEFSEKFALEDYLDEKKVRLSNAHTKVKDCISYLEAIIETVQSSELVLLDHIILEGVQKNILMDTNIYDCNEDMLKETLSNFQKRNDSEWPILSPEFESFNESVSEIHSNVSKTIDIICTLLKTLAVKNSNIQKTCFYLATQVLNEIEWYLFAVNTLRFSINDVNTIDKDNIIVSTKYREHFTQLMSRTRAK